MAKAVELEPAMAKVAVPVQAVRARRDADDVEAALSSLREAAAADRNLMEPLLDAARAHATEGEIVEALQLVFGTYTETPVF